MDWLDSFNALRRRSGLSLDEISPRSGISKSTLGKITAGITKNPSVETMKTLVHAIGYTLDDLDPKSGPILPMVSPAEAKRVKKYRGLDARGKETINILLDREIARLSEIESLRSSGDAGIVYLPHDDQKASAGFGFELTTNEE